MKRNKIVAKKNWFKTENEYYLLVEVESKIFFNKFKIYEEKDQDREAIETNKQLKEYDTIAKIKKKFGINRVELQ